jgi:hypothetical protein
MSLERKIAKRARRKPGRPKLHWKKKKRLDRESDARQYRLFQKPRDMAMVERAVKEGDWYDRVRLNKRKSKDPFKITREEWDTHIRPSLVGCVPYVVRVDTSKAFTLENTRVYDRVTNEIRFDGSEYKLRSLGAVV